MKNNICVNMTNLNDNERATLLALIEKANKSKRLSEVCVGDTFKIADIEFVKLAEDNGMAIVVTKNILFQSEFDEQSSDFETSILLRTLESETLPLITSEIGDDNVVDFTTNLLSDDGLDDYGKMLSKISLPTLDMYRQYRRIFDQYKVTDWWWLATPYSAPTGGYTSSVRCVGSDGALGSNHCRGRLGIRPLCVFKSNIFVS